MISISEEEVHHVQHPHNDAIVITAVIAHLRVHRVLVDNRSSINIIFKKALDQLPMGSVKLKSVGIPLIKFIGVSVIPLRMIDLALYLREAPNRAT